MTQAFAGKPAGEGGFIDHWVDMLDDARERIIDAFGEGPGGIRELEHETVRVSLANLRTFPFIPVREKAGKLRLHGAYFAIRDGVLHLMDDSGQFSPADV